MIIIQRNTENTLKYLNNKSIVHHNSQLIAYSITRSTLALKDLTLCS